MGEEGKTVNFVELVEPWLLQMEALLLCLENLMGNEVTDKSIHYRSPAELALELRTKVEYQLSKKIPATVSAEKAYELLSEPAE